MPCEALNKNTKINIEKRKKEERGGLLDGEGEGETAGVDNNAYLGSSPTAAYDYSKNKRRLENRMSEREEMIKKHQKNAMDADGEPIYINDYSEKASTTGNGK